MFLRLKAAYMASFIDPRSGLPPVVSRHAARLEMGHHSGGGALADTELFRHGRDIEDRPGRKQSHHLPLVLAP